MQLQYHYNSLYLLRQKVTRIHNNLCQRQHFRFKSCLGCMCNQCVWVTVCMCQCVCVYVVSLHRKSSHADLSHRVHGCLSAVSWTGCEGCSQSQSRFNWCQAGLSEKPSETRDAQRDRKPFIRGLPPTAWFSVSLSVLLSLPISLPLKISHHRSVSICSLPLPLTLSWLQTFTIYHSSSPPRCTLSPSLSLSSIVFYVWSLSLSEWGSLSLGESGDHSGTPSQPD